MRVETLSYCFYIYPSINALHLVLVERCGNIVTVAAVARYAGIYGNGISFTIGWVKNRRVVSSQSDDAVLCGCRASKRVIFPLVDVRSSCWCFLRQSSFVAGGCAVLPTFGSHQDEFPLAPTLRRIVISVARSIPRHFLLLFRNSRQSKIALSPNWSLQFQNLRRNNRKWYLEV